MFNATNYSFLCAKNEIIDSFVQFYEHISVELNSSVLLISNTFHKATKSAFNQWRRFRESKQHTSPGHRFHKGVL